MTADTELFTSIEQNRRRIWAICYRMTGSVHDAEDLAHDAIARAVERASQRTGDAEAWLVRIATTICLDHLRRTNVRERTTSLVDPLDLPDLAPGESSTDPQRATILREDVRFAVVVALQALTARQRAALVLHDVCDRSLAEVGEILEIDANAAKALLHRARVALAEARRHVDVDVPVDPGVVEALARAIEAGSLERIAALLAEDAWGFVDGGGVVPVAPGPSLGRDAVMRRFANAWRRLDHVALAAERRRLNGEPAVIVRLADMCVAVIHVESRAGQIVALQIDRDPRRAIPARPA